MPAATPLGEPSQRLHGRPSAARGQRFHLAQPVMAQAQSLPQAMLPHHDSPLTVHALYDHHNAANLSSLTVPHHPAPQMIAFQPPSAPWHHPVHIISSNPYPAPSGPQQNTHKVWILECRSCGTFLTNRGMKAVLLLRPDVSLFSTDALPVNSSAYCNPETLRPSSACRPHTFQPASRTCECLTQTLCCHSCGSSVGYMIVIPCWRCTSSITATNRATNGHRFVFHSGEVNSFERHYIAGEPGIAPFDSPTSPTLSPLFYPPPPSSSHRFTHAHPALPPHALPPLHHYQPAQPHGTVLASTSASDSPRSEYLPTPPLELAELSSSSDSFPFPTFPPSQTSQLYTQYTQAQSQPYFSPQPPPHTQPYPHSHAHAHSPFPIPYSDQKEPLPQQRLRDGDVLYWHYLSRGGEIPEVEEDCRAKNRARGGRARMLFDR